MLEMSYTTLLMAVKTNKLEMSLSVKDATNFRAADC